MERELEELASNEIEPGAAPPRLDDPDAELVRRCQAGGPDGALAFSLLVERHAARIKGRATRILGDESEAEDVVQEVFVNVHRFLHRYRPDRPFSHWLSVVTLNACRIELRRRAGRDRRHEAYRLDPARPSETRLETDPLLRSWLEEALDELPPVTRQAILLRALEGLGYRTIAERLGLSEPATKMRVLRGMKDLRARYAEVDGDGERLDRRLRSISAA
ncbi:MAG: sigma-70 family RNA polymerase sigma factor [Myxococcota bacterium]